MCLIIHKPQGSSVCPDLVSHHVSRNPDGFGFLDLSTGKLTRTMSAKRIKKLCKSDAPFVAHFRYATQGDISKSNIHPFRSGKYLVFMNGTIQGLRNPDGLCDTDVIAQTLAYIKPDCIEQYLSIFDVRFLVYNTKTRQVIRTGDWHDIDGVHYSKCPKVRKIRAHHSSLSSYQTGWPESSRSYLTDYASAPYDSDPASEFDLWVPDSSPVFDCYDEMVAGSNRHLVAVYGTLKQDGSNHRLLDSAEFLGAVVTEEKMRLVCDSLPFVIRGSSDLGQYLKMELYEVNDETLARLDHLEGHPDFYRRERLDAWTLDQLEEMVVRPWVYMVDDQYDTGIYATEWRNDYAF